MAAGIATLHALGETTAWANAAEAAVQLVEGVADAAAVTGVDVQPTFVGTMFGLFFAEEPVTDWESAKRADTKRYAAFHRAMLERGVYLPPSQFETWFVSTAHGDEEIDATVAAAREALAALPSPR
jgi:glutamate-1-semialdehyde 2,1-aminomutase